MIHPVKRDKKIALNLTRMRDMSNMISTNLIVIKKISSVLLGTFNTTHHHPTSITMEKLFQIKRGWVGT